LTWDILFLIPLTWTGPVLAPVINSLTMAILGTLLIHYSLYRKKPALSSYEWTLLVSGSIIVILSYTMDYAGYLLESFSFKELLGLPIDQGLMDYAASYTPGGFCWFLFLFGELYFMLAIISLLIRNRKST
jgi:hypothetical protein